MGSRLHALQIWPHELPEQASLLGPWMAPCLLVAGAETVDSPPDGRVVVGLVVPSCLRIRCTMERDAKVMLVCLPTSSQQ
jgi:hypothetical protein